MKDYYQILGVPKTASASEIKRAYRKWVQQFHPDVNPNPAAQELIREINEAYGVLGDEVKRSAYDDRLDNPFSSSEAEETPPHRDRAYRRGTSRFRPSGKSEQTILMEKSIKVIRGIAFISLVFCGALLLDYFFPSRRQTERIVQVVEVYKTRFQRKYHEQNRLITASGREITIVVDEAEHFVAGTEIVVVESRFFGILSRIETTSGIHTTSNLATIYTNFIFLPVMLLVASVMGIFVKKGTPDFHFSLGLVILALFIFTLIFLFNG
jgi:hypothetical protein